MSLKTSDRPVRRWRVLPPEGTLLINTDLHGNGEDFRRMRAHFLRALERDPRSHWAILGDIVHAPSADARARKPELYNYDDESWAIAEGLIELQREYPDQVHFVLGNHDYAHIGGPRTRKFYTDEAAALEATMAPAERTAMHALFRRALLLVLTPCGALLSHGSPNDQLERAEDLDAIELPPTRDAKRGRAILGGILNAYGQQKAVTERMLAQVSRPDAPLRFVVHGHDRDEEGWFSYNERQLCVVLFGAPRHQRRYLELDLSRSYESSADLRDGVEIRRLYGD